MTQLLVIRHGETDWNRENRFQGQENPPLNARGVHQATLLRGRLRAWMISAAYASDLQRAFRTAEIALAGSGVVPVADPRLRERNYGGWEGLTGTEVQRLFPDSWDSWRDRFANHCPEGGESLWDLRGRLEEFLREICDRHQGQTVLVTAHGGSVKALICVALAAPVEGFRHFRIDNASLTLLEMDIRQSRLRLLNDTCHLAKLS